MSQHTSPPRHAVADSNRLPWGRGGLVALELALQLAAEVAGLSIPRGAAHLRDHLVRAAEQLAASSRASTSSSRSEDDCGSRLIGVSHKPRSGAAIPPCGCPKRAAARWVTATSTWKPPTPRIRRCRATSRCSRGAGSRCRHRPSPSQARSAGWCLGYCGRSGGRATGDERLSSRSPGYAAQPHGWVNGVVSRCLERSCHVTSFNRWHTSTTLCASAMPCHHSRKVAGQE